MAPLSFPILVVSYNDDTRDALAKGLEKQEVLPITCTTFCEAENLAQSGSYNGILIDLPSIIKAKGEEKLVACSLASFYPTLRVRTIGGTLIPMAMPGDAKQDGSLGDFINKTCAAFKPRTLRIYKRRDICISSMTIVDGSEQRSYTQNLCWDGAFIVDMNPERFTVGQELEIAFPELELKTTVQICWIRPWGVRHQPGIGVKFLKVDEQLETALLKLIRHDRASDRDRLVN